MHFRMLAYAVSACFFVAAAISAYLAPDAAARERRELLRSGRSVSATITHLESLGSIDYVMYEYDLEGMKHYGSSRLPDSESARTTVGGTISIRVAASDPELSAYRPEDLPAVKTSSVLPYGLAGVGLAVLVAAILTSFAPGATPRSER